MATEASKEVRSLGEGIAEWERITGQRAADPGCSCCGAPHSLTYTDENGNTDYNDVDYNEDEDSDW